MQLIALVLLLSCAITAAFLKVPSRVLLRQTGSAKTPQMTTSDQQQSGEQVSTRVAKTANILAAATVLFPSLAHADGGDQSAFVVPLAVSFFTMVPFLYYQQALKPKERTVKQIELDENLRP